jgi:hypothetical protein
MLFLPFDNFTITTNLNPEQVSEKLSNVIEPPKRFRNSGIWAKPPSKLYEGKISGYNFRINKIINYRNSFLPIIEGRICPDIIGCQIKIKMQLHMTVMIFMLFWLGNLLPTALSFIVAMIADNTINPLMGLAPLGMCLFAYILCMSGFNWEAKNAKKFFYELFQSE